jgi:hypothetical protein
MLSLHVNHADGVAGHTEQTSLSPKRMLKCASCCQSKHQYKLRFVGSGFLASFGSSDRQKAVVPYLALGRQRQPNPGSVRGR